MGDSALHYVVDANLGIALSIAGGVAFATLVLLLWAIRRRRHGTPFPRWLKAVLLISVALIVSVPWLVDRQRCLFVAGDGFACRDAPHPGAIDAPAEDGSGAASLAWGIFRGATLAGRDLTGRDLQYADLRDASLIGATLASADLQFALASGANLQDADAAGADLRRADLRRSILRGADLRGADLSEALMAGADLSDAILDGARLHGVDLSQVRGLTVAQLARADLGETSVPDDVADDCPAPVECEACPTCPTVEQADTVLDPRDALLDTLLALNMGRSSYYDRYAETMRCWYRTRTIEDDPRRTDKHRTALREGPRSRNLNSTMVIERLVPITEVSDPSTAWFQLEGTYYRDDDVFRTAVRNLYRLRRVDGAWQIDIELEWHDDAEGRCVVDMPGRDEPVDVHRWARGLSWEGPEPGEGAGQTALERRSLIAADAPAWTWPKGTPPTEGYMCDDADACLVVVANACSRGEARVVLDTLPTALEARVLQSSRTVGYQPPAPCDWLVALGPFDGATADSVAGSLGSDAPVAAEMPWVLDVRGWCNEARPVTHAVFGAALVCGEAAQ